MYYTVHDTSNKLNKKKNLNLKTRNAYKLHRMLQKATFIFRSVLNRVLKVSCKFYNIVIQSFLREKKQK